MSVSDTLNAIPNLWNFAAQLRSDWINRHGFLYAVDFEVRLNLDLITAFKVGGLAAVAKTGSPAFVELVNCFETNASLALLIQADRRTYKKLQKLLVEQWKREEKELEEDESQGEPGPEDVLGALSFYVRKIEALKRITRIAASETGSMENLNLERRLNNLNKALYTVRKCLAKIIEENG